MKSRLVLVLALLVAGCGTTTSAETTATPAAGQDKGVRFADCMRENGVAEFPDPGGSDQAYAAAIERASTTAGFDQALEACKALRPAGVLGGKRDAPQQDAALAFAQCIREHGVKDFPDPVDGEPLVDTRKIPSTDAEGGMDVLNAAMKTCADFASKAIGNRP